MSKIKEDQLKKLQDLVGKSNNLQTQIGGLEIQKAAIVGEIFKNQSELQEFQKELEDEYGVISVNITNGEISEIEENED